MSKVFNGYHTTRGFIPCEEVAATYTGVSTPTKNVIKRIGKCAILNFQAASIPANATVTITVPNDFRPKEITDVFVNYVAGGLVVAYTVSIDTDGVMTFTNGGTDAALFQIINSAWEIA